VACVPPDDTAVHVFPLLQVAYDVRKAPANGVLYVSIREDNEDCRVGADSPLLLQRKDNGMVAVDGEARRVLGVPAGKPFDAAALADHPTWRLLVPQRRQREHEPNMVSTVRWTGRLARRKRRASDEDGVAPEAVFAGSFAKASGFATSDDFLVACTANGVFIFNRHTGAYVWQLHDARIRQARCVAIAGSTLYVPAFEERDDVLRSGLLTVSLPSLRAGPVLWMDDGVRTDAVTAIGFTEGLVVAATMDCAVAAWDLASGAARWLHRPPADMEMCAFHATFSGPLVFFSATHFFDVRARQRHLLEDELPIGGDLLCVCYATPDGRSRYVFCAADPNVVQLRLSLDPEPAYASESRIIEQVSRAIVSPLRKRECLQNQPMPARRVRSLQRDLATTAVRARALCATASCTSTTPSSLGW
jgi:hypothetical protein